MPEHRSVLLGVLAAGPRRLDPLPRLAVGEEQWHAVTQPFHVKRAERAAARVRNVAGIRTHVANRRVPEVRELEEPRLAPLDVGAPARIGELLAPWQRQSRRVAEGNLTSFAVADAVARPPVTEDAMDVVAADDLPVHLGHELKVVRPERAGHPSVRHRPVPAVIPLGVDRDPFRVRLEGVTMDRVRVGSRQHRHVHRPAARYQLAKGVAVAHPRAAVVQRDLGGIVADVAARAQAGALRVHAPEIVEPKARVERPRIVLHQRQLRPPQRILSPSFIVHCRSVPAHRMIEQDIRYPLERSPAMLNPTCGLSQSC